jgi:hypothetical protein
MAAPARFPLGAVPHNAEQRLGKPPLAHDVSGGSVVPEEIDAASSVDGNDDESGDDRAPPSGDAEDARRAAALAFEAEVLGVISDLDRRVDRALHQ